MNRELLARTRDRIAAVADEHCGMEHYVRGPDNYPGVMPGVGDPPCGTTACIAGHAVAVHFGLARSSTDAFGQVAAEVLDLPNTALFHMQFWPAKFQAMYHREGPAKAMVAVCDAVLDGTLEVGKLWDEEPT